MQQQAVKFISRIVSSLICPWSIITPISDRTFLKSFESQDQMLVEYIRHQSGDVWKYCDKKHLGTVYNSAFIYVFARYLMYYQLLVRTNQQQNIV